MNYSNNMRNKYLMNQTYIIADYAEVIGKKKRKSFYLLYQKEI
jgi:hypothetical protein